MISLDIGLVWIMSRPDLATAKLQLEKSLCRYNTGMVEVTAHLPSPVCVTAGN